jgi:hypothetical protein
VQLAASARFMRLSLKKAAHAVVSSAAYRKYRVLPTYRFQGLAELLVPGKQLGNQPLQSGVLNLQFRRP